MSTQQQPQPPGVNVIRSEERNGLGTSSLSRIKGLATAAGAIAVIAMAAGCGTTVAGSSGGSTGTTETPQPAYTSTSVPVPGSDVTSTPAPSVSVIPEAPTVVREVTKVIFKVTGYAPNGVSIMYGSDNDNRSPQGSLGPLGDGVAVPWQASMTYDSSAMYYDVTAQLQGGGDVTAQVIIRVTKYYSDDTHASTQQVAAHGHASGEYNIADAQASNF